MNSFLTFGALVFVLSAYFSLTQGETAVHVLDVAFRNGERFTAHPNSGSVTSTLKLIRVSDDTYRIDETTSGNSRSPATTVARFGVTGIDTMLEDVVVVRTNTNSYFQMKTCTAKDAQLFFRLTTHPKLGRADYTYGISAVYGYEKGRILRDVQLSISGFTYTTSRNPQQRSIIHSGRASRLTPHLLWTEKNFYYSSFGDRAMLLTLVKPTSISYDYYVVVFRNDTDFNDWVRGPGEKYSNEMALPSRQIVRYFTENAHD